MMNQLQQFFAKLLETCGAAVEVIDPEGLEVLAPPPVQQALGLAEWARLGFGAELPDSAQRVTLESQMMERVSALLGEHGRHARRILAPANPALANPERMLEQNLCLLNATYRLEGVAPAWTCYQILSFGYTAISDEKRDGILAFGFNRATGATLDGMLPELLAGAEALPSLQQSPMLAGPPLPWERRQFSAILERTLPLRLRHHLQPFFKSMSRRQERDLQRLFAYHQDLRREAAMRLAALSMRGELTERQQAEQARERQRLEAIAREYQAKVADVRQKYAMKVELAWLQTLQLAMPTQRVTVRIKRRKGERLFALDWNPVVRKLEQLPCEYSYTWERPREVCDDALHLVSPAAHGPCPACGKAFCRACHPARCPRCGRAPD
ncbi:MAG TPA: hypothetical protein VM221_14195 [Armatimonadota bacterium]|nr:hypothetical protein [Armatimonadota bacterium]